MKEIKHERCKKCGFRIKGKKPEDGEHHTKGSGGKYAPVKRSKR